MPHPDRAPPDRTAVISRILFKLSPQGGRAFAKLIEEDYVARPDLHAAIADGDPTTDIRLVKVVIHNLRYRWAPRGIHIRNVWGFGYQIDKPTRNRVHRMLAAYGEDAGAATTPPTSNARKMKIEAA